MPVDAVSTQTWETIAANCAIPATFVSAMLLQADQQTLTKVVILAPRDSTVRLERTLLSLVLSDTLEMKKLTASSMSASHASQARILTRSVKNNVRAARARQFLILDRLPANALASTGSISLRLEHASARLDSLQLMEQTRMTMGTLIAREESTKSAIWTSKKEIQTVSADYLRTAKMLAMAVEAKYSSMVFASARTC